MRAFAELYRCLDETTKTSVKRHCLRNYFAGAPAADAAWAVYFLSGRKPRQIVKTRNLREWAAVAAGVPDWLFDECYDAVGDLAETIALVLPEPTRASETSLAEFVEQRLLPLRELPPGEQRVRLESAWGELDRTQRLVFNKLLTSAFRIGVAQTLLTRALADVANVPAAAIAHRLMGAWEPTAGFFDSLMNHETADSHISRPYPFALAHPLADDAVLLGPVDHWLAEWKWDGIRAQCIQRQGEVAIWSRGEELITDRFPELTPAASLLPPGTVLDGEIVAWREGAVLPFATLQRRIGRKSLSKKILAEAPAAYIAFDLLEEAGQDIRALPLVERRRRFESLITGSSTTSILLLSPIETASSWDALAARRAESRARRVEGLMLKRLDAPYPVGRVTGAWWKWKIEPYSIDAVLVYAQRGSGRRASLYTDYTFALWNDGELTPFAKAYSGLTDDEIRQVDRFVRDHTLEKFGPVRRVKPELVFELGFENIQLSTRHKAGVAVRFPRMLRWRTDKRPDEADSLASIKRLIADVTRDA